MADPSQHIFDALSSSGTTRKRGLGFSIEENDAKRPKTDESGVATQVARHYSSRADDTLTRRQESPILALKNLNNWTKSLLISEATERMSAPRVLDLACGKGGEFNKWRIANVSSIVCADIAEGSVVDAVTRYNGNSGLQFPATFVVSNLGRNRLASVLPQNARFDLAACFFAFHYFFESRETAMKMFANVSERLEVGGLFIGTIPNANYLVKRARTDGKVFGNSVYNVKFTDREPPFTDARFGGEYLFKLLDAVDECPEFLVHPQTMLEIAEQFGFGPIGGDQGMSNYQKERKIFTPFPYFYREHLPKYRQRMQKMTQSQTRPIEDDEWEAYGLYSTFVLEKRSDVSVSVWSGEASHGDNVLPRKRRRVDEKEIIRM